MTIDINLSEFEYLADHLTEKECHRLVAGLHYHTFDMPKQIAAVERKLPDDVPCLDLLLDWNSAVGEGKGSTHVEVSHRLNQIGREDLAEWLSKTVFHKVSKDLEAALLVTEIEEETRTPLTVTEPIKKEVEDESPWLVVDSILSIFIVIGLVILVVGSIILCVIYCKKFIKKRKSYKELSRYESTGYSSTDEFVTSESEY